MRNSELHMRKVKAEREGVSIDPVVLNGSTCHVPVAQRVAIVMATYNGSRFVEEQIRSIQAQSYYDWELYVRDDGSCDDTVQKVLQIERDDHRVQLVRDELGNQGAIGNFSVLMEVALKEEADYVFFADQDDIWDPEKIEIMLAHASKLLVQHVGQIPILVHSDLSVVDEKLEVIADSFIAYSRLSPRVSASGILLFRNQVTGCACVINRALLKLATPVPKNVMMHDWWLALLADSAGEIKFVPQPLVKYRQHSDNVLGARSYANKLRVLLMSPRKWREHIDILKRSISQAISLRERIISRGVVLQPDKMKQINVYSNILGVPAFKRAKMLRENNICKNEYGSGRILRLLISLIR